MSRFIVHDIETIKNYFCLVWYDTQTLEYNHVEAFGNDNLIEVRKVLTKLNQSDVTMVSFNGLKFDDVIIAYILSRECKTVADIYRCSQKTIAATDRKNPIPYFKTDHWKGVRRWKMFIKFTTIDLFMLFNTVDRKSLKKLGISMGAPNIQELPYPHNKPLTREQALEMLSYCYNDVFTTSLLYARMYDEIKLRYDIQSGFGIKDVLSSSRSRLADQILEDRYAKVIGDTDKSFKNTKTIVKQVELRDIISDKVQFRSANLQKFLKDLKEVTFKDLDTTKLKFERDLLIGNTTYTFAAGGLHSRHIPTLYYPKKGITYYDVDVSSYYPNLMLKNKTYPRHLDSRFLEVYASIVKERLQAKVDGRKAVADALKITANAVFGKMGSNTSWLCDPFSMYKVTINGQLYLLMLIEKLEEENIDIIYGNTDGIIAMVPDGKLDLMKSICRKWETYLDLALDEEEFHSMIVRDVNNYSRKNNDDTFKNKGSFIREPVLGKSYNAPIIAKAIHEWFYNGVDTKKFIAESNDMKDFILTKAVDNSKFSIELHTLSEDETKIDRTKLQQTNRWIAAKGKIAGALFKVGRNADTGEATYENMLKASNVVIVNELNDDDFKHVNKQYYIAMVEKAKAKYNEQLTIF